MQIEKPKFMDTEFIYYTEDGVKIKETAPEWVVKEYNDFMRKLDEGKCTK